MEMLCEIHPLHEWRGLLSQLVKMAFSIFSIIGTLPIVIVFGLYFIITINSYLKTKNLSTIFFSLSFLATTLTYTVWGLRVFLLPQYDPHISNLLPYWTSAYLFASLSLIFLDFACIELSGIENKRIKQIIYSIILITYSILVAILFIGFEVEITTFMDVSDLSISNIFVYAYFILLLLFYLTLPNIVFINYIRTSILKTSLTYKKVRTIEMGLSLFTIGTILDGARFPSNIGILIARILIMIGGLIMLIGFTFKPRAKED
ncbi:MAG: membrane protein of unknown function [Promethearchaeota archaeon]|nr:MAG: membrane protein of unknown function [Candidatus Lokiarchaeota archaeon]